jgi:hypothetical protein
MVEKFINKSWDERNMNPVIQNEKEIQIGVQQLKEHIKNIQSKCRHTFFETSTSSLRKCLICHYEETICYRFPTNE